jgi:hypothetical protein
MGGDAFYATVGRGFLVEVLDHDRAEFAGIGSLRRSRVCNWDSDEGGGQEDKRRNFHLTINASLI